MNDANEMLDEAHPSAVLGKANGPVMPTDWAKQQQATRSRCESCGSKMAHHSFCKKMNLNSVGKTKSMLHELSAHDLASLEKDQSLLFAMEHAVISDEMRKEFETEIMDAAKRGFVCA